MRTLLVLLAFGSLVVLVVFSIGTLLSILIAAVLALGLDPVVGALVRRGWRRGRAAVAVFAALFAAAAAIVLVTAAPLWEQIVEFADALPGYWDNLTHTAAFENLTSTAGADDSDPQRAQGPRQRAAGRGEHAARHLRRRVRLRSLARHAHVPVALSVDGACDDHGLAVRLRHT